MRQPDQDDPVFLNDILRCIHTIETYTQSGQAEFLQSQLLQDAVIRNFEIIGEATKRLSAEFRQKYPEIPWRRMAGFRDILIHNYMNIDITTVWQAVQEILPIATQIEAILLSIRQDTSQDS